MKETPQQFTQRILGYVKGKQPLAVQAATADTLDRLIKGLSTVELRMRPAPDKWSVSEIIAHLADGEIVGAFRLRFILGSPGAPLVAYDQEPLEPRGINSSHFFLSKSKSISLCEFLAMATKRPCGDNRGDYIPLVFRCRQRQRYGLLSYSCRHAQREYGGQAQTP